MSPEDKDLAYVSDIYDACAELTEFTHGADFAEYQRNKMLRSAVERKLEIVGEAANKISKKFCDRYPNIAWRKAIGLRNVLIHEYGAVRHEIVYVIATRHIPVLMKQMKDILKTQNN